MANWSAISPRQRGRGWRGRGVINGLSRRGSARYQFNWRGGRGQAGCGQARARGGRTIARVRVLNGAAGRTMCQI